MNTFTRDLVEYNGLSNYPKFVEIFNQINVDSLMAIPIQKPDIEQILKVWVDYKIIEKKIIKTPKGVSLEGQNLTGNNLFICGEIYIKVEYVSLDSTQGVYSSDTKVPFGTCVVLPDGFNESTIVHVDLIIEDILCEQIDCRSIYTNITAMAIADIC